MLEFGIGTIIILVIYFIVHAIGEGLKLGAGSLGTFLDSHQLIIIIVLSIIILPIKSISFVEPIKGEKGINVKALIERITCIVSTILIVATLVGMIHTACITYDGFVDLLSYAIAGVAYFFFLILPIFVVDLSELGSIAKIVVYTLNAVANVIIIISLV